MADMDESTSFTTLQQKYPSPHPDSSIPSLPVSDSESTSLTVSEEEAFRAIKSFPNGSGGGPDLLKPQHLMDMTWWSDSEEGGASHLHDSNIFCPVSHGRQDPF